jgi:APA family basic amino acid/polyamine antiporter
VSATPSTGRLGLWSATALVIGHTIGVGIFLTPAELIGALRAPGVTIALWTICGAIVLAGALTFGELASRYPESGGLYVYLREAWGPRVAFLYGWQSLLIMDPGVTAALAAGAVQYVVAIWPDAGGAERAIAVALLWAIAGVNMAGLRIGARAFGALTVIKLAALAAIVVMAFAGHGGSWAHFAADPASRAGAPPLGAAIAIGLVGVFFSFGGFWETSRIAGEVRDPQRTLPRALVLGVLTVTLIYVMTTAAFIVLVPPAAATSAAAFARQAGEAMLGSAGPGVLAVVVLVSVVASAMAMIMVAPRLYEAMSLDGLFPAWLAVRSSRTGAPMRSTIWLTSIATMFVALGTFDQIVAVFVCTTLVFVALAAGAVFRLRRTSVRAPFLTPGHPLTPALFIALLLVIVAMIAINRPWQAATGLVAVLIGVPAARRLTAPAVAKGGSRP